MHGRALPLGYHIWRRFFNNFYTYLYLSSLYICTSFWSCVATAMDLFDNTKDIVDSVEQAQPCGNSIPTTELNVNKLLNDLEKKGFMVIKECQEMSDEGVKQFY